MRCRGVFVVAGRVHLTGMCARYVLDWPWAAGGCFRALVQPPQQRDGVCGVHVSSCRLVLSCLVWAAVVRVSAVRGIRAVVQECGKAAGGARAPLFECVECRVA